MNNKLKQCKYCHGTGIKIIDINKKEYDIELCDCSASSTVLRKVITGYKSLIR